MLRNISLEPLHSVALVGEAAAEEMDQERIRRVAGLCHRYRHAVASLVRLVDGGGDALTRHRPPPRFRPDPASRRRRTRWMAAKRQTVAPAPGREPLTESVQAGFAGHRVVGIFVRWRQEGLI